MDKIHEFSVDQPLTAARRKAIEQQVKQKAKLSPKPVTYEWEDDTLQLAADPVRAEVKFHPKKVELFATAPLWARLLFTAKKKTLLIEQIELILRKTGFISSKKAK